MKMKITFSIWNIGEVLGALDKYASKGLISKSEFKTSLLNFISESIKMARLDSLQLLPFTSNSLITSWLIVLKHHMYEADALQVAASKEANCYLFLSADNKLIQVVNKEGVKALNIETEAEKALSTLEAI